MPEARLEDLLYGCETFDKFQEKVHSETEIRQMPCSQHGDVDHAYCKLNGIGICLECIKTRVFRTVRKLTDAN